MPDALIGWANVGSEPRSPIGTFGMLNVSYNSGTNTLTVTGGSGLSPKTMEHFYKYSYDNSLDLIQSETFGVYNCKCNINIGNGSTSTYFASEKDSIYLEDTFEFRVLDSGTARLGASYSNYGVKGSTLSLAIGKAYSAFVAGNATLYLYDTSINMRNDGWLFVDGTIDFRNSLVQGNKDDARIYFGTNPITLSNVVFSYWSVLCFQSNPTASNVLINGCSSGLRSTANGVTFVKPSFDGNGQDCMIYNSSTTNDNNLTLIDPSPIPSSIYINSADNLDFVQVQHTVNLVVTDMGGGALQGATVVMRDRDSNQAFSTTTDANGKIAAQTVVSRKWIGTGNPPPVTDCSPFSLVVSKTGYSTQQIDNITLNKPLDWVIEVPVYIDPGSSASPAAPLAPLSPLAPVAS